MMAVFLLIDPDYLQACPPQELLGYSAACGLSEDSWVRNFGSIYTQPWTLIHDELATVNCCNDADGTCQRQYGNTGNDADCYPFNATFSEANVICEDEGLRLCRSDEILNGNCCQTGCSFSYHYGWVDNSKYIKTCTSFFKAFYLPEFIPFGAYL